MDINFFRGEHFYLSNFYEASITYDELTYLNNEAAFQSMKLANREERRRFTYLAPGEAKYEGRKVKLRSDWEEVKEQIMYEIVKAKFIQNEDIKEKLIRTGRLSLEEGNTWGDRIWGTVSGRGENKLGKILMQIRSEFIAEKVSQWAAS